MAERFDPYYVWLSVPPDEQPPNCYRLLGIPLFEANPDVIDGAANRQTAHIQTFETGPQGQLAQQLLKIVATTRVLLLDPVKKAAYDEKLRQKLAAQAVPATQAASPPTAVAPVAVANTWTDLIGNAAPQPNRTAAKPKHLAEPRRKIPWVFIAPLAGVLLVVGALVWRASQPDVTEPAKAIDGVLVIDWPAADREGTTLTIDDAHVALPAAGEFDRRYGAGPHHVVVRRPAYKPFDKTLTLAEGQRQSIIVAWQPRATLAIDWPMAQRSGAELTVDGQLRPSSDRQPMELPVEAGNHSIRIAWHDAPPFESEVEVLADQRKVLEVPERSGTLVVDWPAEDRNGADLKIDGESKPAGSSAGPLEFFLKPGQHTVRTGRPGFKPIEQTVTVESAQRKLVALDWVPDRPAARVVATNDEPAKHQADTKEPDHQASEKPDSAKVPSTEKPVAVGPVGPRDTALDVVKPLADVRQPIPAAGDQEEIAKQLDELYKSKKAPSKDEATARAKQLYGLADKSDKSTEQYVLMSKGIDWAGEAGNVDLAIEGIDSLGGKFAIDPLESKEKLLEKLTKTAATPDLVQELVAVAKNIAEQAVAADRFDLAQAAIATAAKAGAKKAAGAADLRRETEVALSARRNEIKTLQMAWETAQKARSTLEQNPADGEANSTLGRWYCFYKADWARGLPLLAKGKDERLNVLAQQELQPPAQAAKQVELADGWLDLVPQQPALFRAGLALHAESLYRKALPKVESVLTKAAVDHRLKMIAEIRGDSGGASAANAKMVTNSIGMKLKLMPAGEFKMGSPDSEPSRNAEWEKQHPVRITKPFYLGIFPVTQAEYERVMSTNPSYFSANNRKIAAARLNTTRFPVENISPNDADDFCRRLSELPSEKTSKRNYRLPTEAEWEYACRAGTTTPYYCGTTVSLHQANFNGDEHSYVDEFFPANGRLGRTTTVGSYPPNPFGLYDMHGNVEQIAQGFYSESYYDSAPADDPPGASDGQLRMVRGSSWADPAQEVRTANRRLRSYPQGHSNRIGFRVVCECAADPANEDKPSK